MKKKYSLFSVCCILLSLTFLVVYFIWDVGQYNAMLWLPIVLFLALGVTTVFGRAILVQQHKSQVGGHLLADAFKRTGAISITIAMGVIAFFLFLFGFIFWRWDSGSEIWFMGTAVFIVLVIVSLVIGLYSLGRAINLQDIDKSRIREILAKTPEKITWIYERQTHSSNMYAELQGKFATIDVWIEDGTLFQMIVSPEEKRAFLILLKQEAPQAHFGYDLKLAQRFKPKDFEQIIIA
ncbi:MAG: hypothetical protein GY943_03890 [Chloroflexi bacterium]|nr:hypothetical protein [Chloroflexota bacterium]